MKLMIDAKHHLRNILASSMQTYRVKQYRLARKTGYLRTEKPPQMPSHVRTSLRDYFKPHNARLAALVGRDFGWDELKPSLLECSVTQDSTLRTSIVAFEEVACEHSRG